MRVGKFGYLNNFLPYYYLKDVEIVEASPTEMAHMLLKGEIDYAPIPSFFFLKNKEELRHYSFCVASKQRVLSVVVVSKNKKLDDGKIAVTPHSMTSVNLLRIILNEKGLKNKLVFMDTPRACELLDRCDHALVIGDEAIKARMIYRVLMDLGEEWFEITGLPMVFGISSSLRGVDASIADSKIMESIDRGFRNYEVVVEAAEEEFRMPREFLEEYFKILTYKLGSREIKGLKTFEEMCHEHGLFEEEP
jgi:chorismate dehydratase